MNIWSIGLSTWIIQDGNYDDFKVGMTSRFALEFYAERGFVKAAGGPIEATSIGADRYRVRARIVMKTDEVCVIDFGLLAFSENRFPGELNPGELVEAEIYLGIDPFFYFEYLYKREGMPRLTYTWHIDRIDRSSGPLLLDEGKRAWVRDETQISIEQIDRTNAWKEKDSPPFWVDYSLYCSCIGGPEYPDSSLTQVGGK